MRSAATLGLVLLLAATAGAAALAEDVLAHVAGDETDDATRRLRVGLVLGGGGARGAAHVGVLRELERMRIPVDAIVGTSMGAVVGGLYASGMSVDQLEETLATLDWADAMSDRPDRSDLSFRRKKDDEQFPIAFELGFHEGEIQIPHGVIQGHTLDLILRDLTLHTAFVDDFDDLPIPFRAIASDIVKGEAYVMGDGDLALAIRASMSVPGAFAPVLRDGRLLVDGGLVGNLGVNVVQNMDVDVIIAVDVEFPLYTMEELDSAVAISEQMLTLLIRKETLRQIENLGPRDILIRPDLGTFASTNFKGVIETIEPGAAATRAVADQLAVVAIDAAAYQSYSAQRLGVDIPQDNLAFVRIVHDVKVAPEILTGRMDVHAGDPIDPDILAREADRLFGLQLFERVGYRLVQESGQTGVEFTAVSKSWGHNYLRFGLSLENDFEGSTGFNFTTRWRRPELNSLGAELLTDLQLGTDPLFSTEFYQPLRFDSRVFVAPVFTVRQTNRNIFDMNEAVARLRVSEAILALDVGAEIGNAGEFRIGVFRGIGEGRVRIGDPSVPTLDFDSGGLRAQLRFDTFDDAQFPRSGIRSKLEWIASRPNLGADTRFDTVEFEVDSAFSYGKNTLVAGLSYATTVDSISPVQNHFLLGGFLRLSGLDRGQLSGPHAGLARLVYFRQVGDSAGGFLELPLYIGASLEAGNVWQNRQDVSFDSLLANGSLFFGLDSFFGPLYLAAGFSEDGETSLYLFIGATPL